MEPVPCPCCGESGPPRNDKKRRLGVAGLRAGECGDGSMEVACYGCGLRITEPLPDDWPPGVEPGNLRALKRLLLHRVIERWNRRETDTLRKAVGAYLLEAYHPNACARTRDHGYGPCTCGLAALSDVFYGRTPEPAPRKKRPRKEKPR